MFPELPRYDSSQQSEIANKHSFRQKEMTRTRGRPNQTWIEGLRQ